MVWLLGSSTSRSSNNITSKVASCCYGAISKMETKIDYVDCGNCKTVGRFKHLLIKILTWVILSTNSKSGRAEVWHNFYLFQNFHVHAKSAQGTFVGEKSIPYCIELFQIWSFLVSHFLSHSFKRLHVAGFCKEKEEPLTKIVIGD